ncbi:protein of unknown function [Pseudodesulfovibrio piezophilus C1TLV30]|uniref:Uncharacterized protein n=1 Tax=Pseudodesulfovibrio piezophilus (strain DSM 21447 / JCM 15486 / C1TLV30) TaxID=1322246 RepID=M1WX22_PSEP2|nr:protein of unknown function [Pseudodesulfovibrio piezophilus C1TLV30]
MTFDILSQELGKRLSTKEVASFLGLDKETVRKHFEKLGGIQPTGPKGRILFFERNVVDALRRNNALKNQEEWANSLEREGSKARRNQDEAVRHKNGRSRLGNQTKAGGLVKDRHGLFTG